jgi:hypothetical protein
VEQEALPEVEQSTAVSDPKVIEGQAREVPEGEAKPEGEAAPEKTESELRMEQLERENKRMQRGIDRRTRQLAEERARNGLTRNPIGGDNQDNANDSEPLSLTRAELAQFVKAEAEKLAPTLADQQGESQRRQGVIDSLAKTWGQEKFDEVASDLDEAFGGLTDRSGAPKPAIEAVFESDNPTAVIEWLADPENSDEAERISKLSAVKAGREIAKLESKIAAKAVQDKPEPSKAPKPLEPVRGVTKVNGMPDPKNTRAWMDWRNAQEAKGLA